MFSCQRFEVGALARPSTVSGLSIQSWLESADDLLLGTFAFRLSIWSSCGDSAGHGIH